MGRGGKKANKNQHHAKGKLQSQSDSKNLPKPGTCAASVDGCHHVPKAVRLQALQSSLPHVKIGSCKVCGKGPVAKKGNSKEVDNTIKDICICLRCGHQACSRQCKQQHAYQHYMTTPSHCITLNIRMWNTWCYECDMELIATTENSQLGKSLKYIRSRLPADILSTSDGVSVETSTDIDAGSSSTYVKGLKNLGNTCFFNSVVQNLAQTKLLRCALKESMKEERSVCLQSTAKQQDTVTCKITTGPGTITQALKDLLTEFSRSGQKILSPGRLFGEISKRAPQFRGFQQHDSQELLRYLLDGMKTEELKRIEIGVKERLASKEEHASNSKPLVQGYLKNAKTFVDDIFGGTLVSTILCHSCKNISHTYDGFLDLSLPASDFEKSRSLKNLKKFKGDKESPNETKKSEPDLNGEETTALKGKKLTKHQKKVQARQERKARRAKDRNSGITRSQSEEKDSDSSLPDPSHVSPSPSQDGKSTVPLSNEDVPCEVPSTALIPENQSSDQLEEEQCQSIHCENLPPQNDDDDTTSNPEMDACSTSGNAAISDDDITDDEDMNPAEQERLSAQAMDLFQKMVKSCSVDTKPYQTDFNEEDEDNDLSSPLLTKDSHSIPTGFPSNAENNELCEKSESETELSDCFTKLRIDGTEKCSHPIDSPGSVGLLQLQMGDVTSLSDSSARDSELREVIDDTSVSGNEKCQEFEIKNKDECSLSPSTDDKMRDSLLTETLIREPSPDPNVKHYAAHEQREYSTNGSKTKTEGVFKEPIVDQLVDIFNKVSEDHDHQENCSSASEPSNALPKMQSKDECDSGFSSIGEICSETANEDEETCSDIEDFSELQVLQSSVLECFKYFCSLDVLDGKNKFACDNCLKMEQKDGDFKEKNGSSSNFVLTEATKQFMIFKPPKVLTLHLKRFEQNGRQLRKINRPIEFPLNIDISPFCHKKAQLEDYETKYKLYGLVEHSGSLHGGHYVAYVRNEEENKWSFISDTRVSVVSEEVVLRKQAYLLFYEQMPKEV